MLNLICIAGNVVGDPQTFANGKVVKFSLANDVKYGEKTTTSFVQVTCFGKLGDVVMKHALKGTRLIVRGRIQQDCWEDKDGKKRDRVGIIMEGFDFVGGDKPQPQAASNAAQNAGNGASAPAPKDEIPF